MATTNELVIETFNRLLAACKASEQAFRIAAHAVQQQALRMAFNQYSHQRGRMASELRMEIRLLGGEPEMLDGMLLPPGLAAVMSASDKEDEQAVLSRCVSLEEEICRTFQDALEDPNMPLELAVPLRRHAGSIRLAIERLHTLERPLAARVF